MVGPWLRRLDNKGLYRVSGGSKLCGEQILFLTEQLERFATLGLYAKIEPRSRKPHPDGYFA